MNEVVEQVSVGPWTVELTRPADAEALIDEDAFGEDEFLPYWAMLWPSGLALAEHVAGLDLRGVDVLELGCGLGLPSLVAALGGARVVATDWAEDALRLLQRNAAANGVELETAFLRWDDPTPLGGRRFPLVLAADVLYEERNGTQLASLLPDVLEAGGEAVIADPGRKHAAAFLDAVQAAGWRVDPIPGPHSRDGSLHVLRNTFPAR